MSTYSWVCHPVAGDGEEPPAWPAHPRENQFLPPSREWKSVLRENRCEMGTVGCSPPPGPDQYPQEGAPVTASANTGGVQSEAPQMQLSKSWALGPRIKLNFQGSRHPCPHHNPHSIPASFAPIQTLPSGTVPWWLNPDIGRQGGTGCLIPR